MFNSFSNLEYQITTYISLFSDADYKTLHASRVKKIKDFKIKLFISVIAYKRVFFFCIKPCKIEKNSIKETDKTRKSARGISNWIFNERYFLGLQRIYDMNTKLFPKTCCMKKNEK